MPEPHLMTQQRTGGSVQEGAPDPRDDAGRVVHVRAHHLDDDPAVLAQTSAPCRILRPLFHGGMDLTVILDDDAFPAEDEVAPRKKQACGADDDPVHVRTWQAGRPLTPEILRQLWPITEDDTSTIHINLPPIF